MSAKLIGVNPITKVNIWQVGPAAVVERRKFWMEVKGWATGSARVNDADWWEIYNTEQAANGSRVQYAQVVDESGAVVFVGSIMVPYSRYDCLEISG